MLIDARKLDDDSVLQGDICIVGAGAAGISIALDWLHSSSNIILLESGGFDYSPDVQALNDGQTTGQKYYPLQSSRLRQFGGTTALWAGMCAQLDEIDFKTRDWVADSGWAFSKSELASFYARANEILKIMGEQKLNHYIVSKYAPCSINSNKVWNKLWQHSKLRFGRDYRQEIVKAKNITLVTHASVVNIECNSSISKVVSLETKNHSGKTHKVTSKQFILAAGAIQNARLLLASRSQAKNGIGNDFDLVGRYFMEHLEVDSSELWLSKPFDASLYTRQKSRLIASAEIAIEEKIQKQYRILNGTVSLTPLNYARLVKPRIQTWRDKDPRKAMGTLLSDWSAASRIVNAKDTPPLNAYQLTTRLEQAPNRNSRIQLLNDKDSLGLAKVKLHWQLTELEKKSLRAIQMIVAEYFGEMNLGRVKLSPFLTSDSSANDYGDLNGGWHHMGTTKMNQDKTKGVVDTNCKVHGIANLYIAGSSCFPTSGSANPTLTLIALSLRLSDHLKQGLAE
ncbi:MAG: choline dehydrogenase-like flavoprotein [Arenicella sp.]|jgi:choline dehydrogenase-like flavoprotein